MPGYSVSMKERMLYSSCKNAVVDVIEKLYSIEITKKVEVDSGAEQVTFAPRFNFS
jgi:twinfilin-like protein